MNAILTPNETSALRSLRENSEGLYLIDAERRCWHSVYLDNAKPAEWTGSQWAGTLSALEQKGLYRADNQVFGLVLEG